MTAAIEHEAHIAVRAWGLLALDAGGEIGGRVAALVAEQFPGHAIVHAGRPHFVGSTDICLALAHR